MSEHRVLIVEDEPRMRELLLRVVPDMGFDAVGARSAEEAHRLLEAQPADIVILDLNLPGQSGLDFLEQVRRTHPNVQAIVLTGFGDLPAAQRAIRLDAVDFLTKPTPLGELEKSLERAGRRAEEMEQGKDLPDLSGESGRRGAAEAAAPTAVGGKLEDLERQHILAALERHRGNRSETAAELGISLRTLYYRLSEYQKQGFLEHDEGDEPDKA